MNSTDWLILRFCTQEITNQQDSPLCVYDLVKAWYSAIERAKTKPIPDLEDIRHLGFVAKPHANAPGWRRVWIRVGEDRSFPAPDDVPRLLVQWHEALVEGRMNPEEAYKAFEEIHPFRDGNGRTGKIIYNWLHGTLKTPRMPPNFWGGIP